MDIENLYNTTELVYNDEVECYCPLGKGMYTNKFKITVYPDESLPDYVKLHQFIQSLKGEVMIIEEAVATVLDSLVFELDPKGIEVESFVQDANHPKVRVTNKYYRPERNIEGE